MVNTKIKPTAHNIGVSKVIEPFHIVATQLKIFTPVGTAINIVAYMKNSWPVTGMPGAKYGQHTNDMAHLKAYYENVGGVVA